MDVFFLNNEESESCLSCMWNIWSLPNVKTFQIWKQSTEELELVFVKHCAPNTDWL